MKNIKRVWEYHSTDDVNFYKYIFPENKNITLKDFINYFSELNFHRSGDEIRIYDEDTLWWDKPIMNLYYDNKEQLNLDLFKLNKSKKITVLKVYENMHAGGCSTWIWIKIKNKKILKSKIGYCKDCDYFEYDGSKRADGVLSGICKYMNMDSPRFEDSHCSKFSNYYSELKRKTEQKQSKKRGKR